MDLGFDLRKQSVLQIIPNRELRLDMDFDTTSFGMTKTEKETRIFSGVYTVRGCPPASAVSDL